MPTHASPATAFGMNCCPGCAGNSIPARWSALLRLGTLAGEVQAVVDALVDEWFDRCVVIEDRMAARIELAGLAEQPRYLLCELLMAVWRRQGWPMQSMGWQKWDELGELAALANAPRRVFPGGVSVEVAAGRMRLTTM